ncbi:FHA domain-containing protein [Nocardia sp. NPDC058658]|uniref:FHA domain-containing protein n=1 Tax=Nocardia sp. NPDC058658 TaxID=3346580 RepID=UPI003648B846
MLVCADGHESRSTDYCDVCGSALTGAPAPDPASLRLCPNCQAPTSGRFCEGCGHDSALPSAAGSRAGDRPEATFRARPDRAETSQGGARPGPARAESEPADSSRENARFDPPRTAGTDPTRTGVQPGFDPTLIAGTPPAAAKTWVARIFADRELYARVQARKGPDAERVEFPDFCPERRIILHGNRFLIGKRSASQGIVPEIDLGIAPVDIGVSRAHAMIQVDQGGALTVTDLGSTNGTSLDGAEASIPPQQAIALREGSRIHVGGWTTIAISAEA